MTERITIKFDHHDPAYRDDWEKTAMERATKTPVAWTEAHGGYWVMSGYEEVSRVVNDWETFSSAHGDPEKPFAKGILIPELPHVLSLSESDPPLHTGRRMIEAPFFAPANVRKLGETVQSNVEEALSHILHKGELDFARDYAMRAAGRSAMGLVGIDPDQWEIYMLSAHKSSLLPSDHPDYPTDEIKMVQGLLKDRVIERRGCPQKDLISGLVTGKANGCPLTDEVAVGMLSAVVFGGFGTVMGTTLNILKWLENHRDMYADLLTDDELFDRLFDETLRMYPPTHGVARTVAKDVEIRGQQLKKGDRVLMSFAAANRDPAFWENPEEFRLDRTNGKEHFSFSGGNHRCLGAPLGRAEARALVRGVLTHMPDYKIDHARTQIYPSFANNAGYTCMPATFTPKKAA